MADDNPKIVTTLELARLFVTGLLFLQALFLWQRNHWFALAYFIGCLTTGSIQVRILSTKLTSAGVSQFRRLRRIELRWDEIKTVNRKLRSITIAGTRGSIIVPLESFYDTKAATQFLNSHLPKHLRQD